MSWSSMWLFALLALGEATVERRQDDDVPIKNYRRRLLESVVTLGDYVYFDGGRISTYIEGTSDGNVGMRGAPVINTTRFLRLDVSWSNHSIGQGEVDFVDIEREEPLPVMKGALWADESTSTIYRWGGERSFHQHMPEDEVALWGFKPDSNGKNGTWGKQTPWDSEFFDGLVASTHGASAVCEKKGYWIGGYAKPATDPYFEDVSLSNIPPVPGILEYDFDSRKWKNDSTVPLNSPHGTFINGVASCAKGFVADPMVVVIGGYETEPDRIQDQVLRSMDNVTFWDPTESRWHWQKATGDVPEGKGKPCAVGSKGDGTYEITMYGGINRPGQGISGDIYVLSLPGFRWFKVNGTFPERHNHACTVVGKGKRQMLSTGGVVKDEVYDDMDPWPHALGIFDLTDLVWKSQYDVNASDYRTPEMIRKWYDDGGMYDVEWSSDAVRDMFVDPLTGYDDSDSYVGSPNPSGPSIPTGAIAGGIVGGVLGLALIGGIIFFVRRRRRQSAASELPSTPHGETSSTSPKFNEASSPMSELPTSPRYELDAGEPKPELGGDYSQSPDGPSSLPRPPQGFFPQGISLQGVSPQGFSPQDFSPQGISPQTSALDDSPTHSDIARARGWEEMTIHR